AMVGENGPELVQFGRAGHVFPTGTGPRGGGMVINIDARGADMAAVARIESGLASMNRDFEQRSIAAINGQRKRCGSFAASFRRYHADLSDRPPELAGAEGDPLSPGRDQLDEPQRILRRAADIHLRPWLVGGRHSAAADAEL